MRRVSDAGVKAVDRAQHLDGLLGIVQRFAAQRGLIGPLLILRIAGTGVPGAGNGSLKIGGLAVLENDPVSNRTARCLPIAYAPGCSISVSGPTPGPRTARRSLC